MSRLGGSPIVCNARDPWLPDFIVCRTELAKPVLQALWGRDGELEHRSDVRAVEQTERRGTGGCGHLFAAQRYGRMLAESTGRTPSS